ncbi:MAG: glycosyltransferase [Phycisphaerales bacterium]
MTEGEGVDETEHRTWARKRPAKRRVLVTTWSRRGVAGQLLEPLLRSRRALRERDGLTVQIATVPKVQAAADLIRRERPDIALLAPSWREASEEVVAAFEGVRAGATEVAVGCLDGFDGPSTPYLDALPFVDGYFKKQLFRDRSLYTREIAGGHPFVAWMWESGIATDRRWNFGSVTDASLVQKLALSWNIGDRADHRRAIARLAHSSASVASDAELNRSIDVHCRVGLTGGPSRSWYARHRRHALAMVGALDSNVHVVSNPAQGDARRISRRRFRGELRRARIVVSPFGWGEICHRDFEAIVAGAVLVKPSMEHLETRPDAYRAGATYVPVAWDLSDLSAAVEALLADEGRRRAMVEAARDRLRTALSAAASYRRVRTLLRRVERAASCRVGGDSADG